MEARRAHNPKVVGSIPASRYESHQMCVQITPSGFIRSSRLKVRRGDPGSLTEWLKVPDCKSVVVLIRGGSIPSTPTKTETRKIIRGYRQIAKFSFGEGNGSQFFSISGRQD